MPTASSPAPRIFARLGLLGGRAVGARVAAAARAARCPPLRGVGFFRSGLMTKLRDWQMTMALFTDEYKVPLLGPEVRALMGTGGELVLPVLLALGLCGRFAAAGLTVVNIVAVISLADIPRPALLRHVFWGSLLMTVLPWGPGAIWLARLRVPTLRRWIFGEPAASGAAPCLSRAA